MTWILVCAVLEHWKFNLLEYNDEHLEKSGFNRQQKWKLLGNTGINAFKIFVAFVYCDNFPCKHCRCELYLLTQEALVSSLVKLILL